MFTTGGGQFLKRKYDREAIARIALWRHRADGKLNYNLSDLQ